MVYSNAGEDILYTFYCMTHSTCHALHFALWRALVLHLNCQLLSGSSWDTGLLSRPWLASLSLSLSLSLSPNSCIKQWFGDDCSQHICSRDATQLCKNGGTCVVNPSNISDHLCACPLGYSGRSCQYLTHGSMCHVPSFATILVKYTKFTMLANVMSGIEFGWQVCMPCFCWVCVCVCVSCMYLCACELECMSVWLGFTE